MSLTRGAPSHKRFSHFRCEEATIIDVNRESWTVRVVSRFTDKEPEDVQILSPYLHHVGGEGFHHMPEPGATCMLAWPSDNTPPIILGYKGVAGVVQSENTGESTAAESDQATGSSVSFRARRPRMDPGDLGVTGRDGNFIMLRRGGVVEVGATPLAQRIYLPIKNFIKDFSENYEQTTLAGDVSWRVERVEDDPGGNAPAVWIFHMNEFAQDAKASVRISHYPPPPDESAVKVAMEIVVAPQGIDKATGSVSEQVYLMSILSDGTVNEVVGKDRTTTVTGDESLSVDGAMSLDVGGDYAATVGGTSTLTAAQHVLDGPVALGSAGAASPSVLGDKLLQWAAAQVWPVDMATLTAKPTPASLAQLQTALSTKVFVE